jgi:pimeloyl-ACP methyl ester carboxylesterase
MSNDVHYPQFHDIEDFPNPAADSAILPTMARVLLGPWMSWAVPGTNQPHFHLRKIRPGSKHAVIVINGFMSKGDHDTGDWETAIHKKFARATWYHLDWDAFRPPHRQFGDLLTIDGVLDRMGGKREPGIWEAWHATMLSAEQAGELLAQAIRSTPGWRFTLAGHSLGARVIHFALKELARHPRKRVENVYLLGAAVGGGEKDEKCWATAISAVKGRIFNCYSIEDGVLDGLYRGANLLLSKPAGFYGINLQHEQIFHFDCRHLVKGHMKWKSNFGEILSQLKDY